MTKLIVENKHEFDDSKTAERHGHIIYCDKNTDGESDGSPECEGIKEYNDGLEPDEMKSDPFKTKNGGYVAVDFLARINFITPEDTVKLYHAIDQSNLL